MPRRTIYFSAACIIAAVFMIGHTWWTASPHHGGVNAMPDDGADQDYDEAIRLVENEVHSDA